MNYYVLLLTESSIATTNDRGLIKICFLSLLLLGVFCLCLTFLNIHFLMVGIALILLTIISKLIVSSLVSRNYRYELDENYFRVYVSRSSVGRKKLLFECDINSSDFSIGKLVKTNHSIFDNNGKKVEYCTTVASNNKSILIYLNGYLYSKLAVKA